MGITSVERETGLKKETLRVWERRYGFPAPIRDDRGERLYPAEQVQRLRLIKRLLDQGLRPGRVVPACPEELTALAEAACDCLPTPPPPQACCDCLTLLATNQADAVRGSLQQQLARAGLQRFVLETVAPLTTQVGLAWMRGEIQVHQEHLYTEQVQNVLRGAIAAAGTLRSRPRVLLTTLPEEPHGLGLLMVEAMLVPEGVYCLSLGTRTPHSDICAAARAGGFDIVAVSFSAAVPLRNAWEALLDVRSQLDPGVQMWAGGGLLAGRPGNSEAVRVFGGLEELPGAIAAWRDAHPGVPG